MKRDQKSVVLLLLFLLIFLFSHASSEFLFSDDRFRDKLTTENLDAIIDEYELYDGWYWTTLPDVSQTFHGHPESPGWTSSVENAKRKTAASGALRRCRKQEGSQLWDCLPSSSAAIPTGS